MKKTNSKIKAIGMISGGLDSALVVKIIKDLGVEVFGLHFTLPWNVGKHPKATDIADQLGVPLKIIFLEESFLKMIQSPKHGYGSAFNPCVDCRAFNLAAAKKYMEEIGAEFVFTGEVLGQRPMSQMKNSLRKVENDSGLVGRLLRPLSAKLLEPTIPEQEGKIDRNKLFSFSGRSRSELQQMGRDYSIVDYIPPGGGCLLTDKNFGNRLRDSFQHGYRDLNDIISLRWGKHFRLSPKFKAIVGRNDYENRKIIEHAHNDDFIFILADENPGPTIILRGENPDDKTRVMAALLVKKYSKFRNNETKVIFWQKKDPQNTQVLLPKPIAEKSLASFKI
ncbi:MAG: hypothetical protein P9M07_00385 [Candidatus Aceula meridiana]|nr:hypothetical protein [Candidatus Aceula meridiana]